MDIKKTLSNKRNLLVLIGIIILIIVIVALVVGKTTDTQRDEDVTVALEDSLKNIAGDYYENTFYAGLQEEDKSKVSMYSDTGINLNLYNLDNTSNFSDEVTKQLEDKKCDYEESKVWIYPTDSYGQTNYTVEVELSCEK